MRLLVWLLLLTSSAPIHADNDREFMAQLVARTFFHALLDGADAKAALPLCAARVNLDGLWVENREELARHLERMSLRARQHGLRLKKIVILSHAEAVRRYGPPPDRLRGAAGPTRLVALARFNVQGAVAILGRTGAFWKIVAITD